MSRTSYQRPIKQLTKRERTLIRDGYTNVQSFRLPDVSNPKAAAQARVQELRGEGHQAQAIERPYQGRVSGGYVWRIYVKRTTATQLSEQPAV